MSAITPKAKAPKSAPATSPKIGAEYSKLIAIGANTENAKIDFNFSAIKFVQWLNAEPASVEIKRATLNELAKDLTFSMPVKGSHVQVLKTACLIFAAFGIEHKVGEILTLAKRIDTEVGVAGAPAHIGKFATLQELKDGTKTIAENKDEEKPAKETKVLGLAQIFQKTIKEAKKLDLTKVKLEGLDIQYLIEMNKILAIVAKNSGLDKAKA